MKVIDIENALESLAPKSLAEEWDNVGLMCGDEEQTVNRIFVCLELNAKTLSQATVFCADLIITHHPLIFKPLSSVTENTAAGHYIRTLIKENISLISMHTNFDKANGGMNDLLANVLGLEDVRHYFDDECFSPEGKPLSNIGRVGTLEPSMTLEDFSDFVRATLGCVNLRTVGNLSEEISTVALCSGSGGDLLGCAYHAGADVYLTGDISHHEAQSAVEIGLNLIDAGHFETENIICDFLESFINENFPEIEVLKAETVSYFN